jgi:multidrug efflux pump subunit AcrB
LSRFYKYLENYRELEYFLVKSRRNHKIDIKLRFKGGIDYKNKLLFRERVIAILNSYGGLTWKVSADRYVLTNMDKDKIAVDFLYEIQGYNLPSLYHWLQFIRQELEKNPRIRITTDRRFESDDNMPESFKLPARRRNFGSVDLVSLLRSNVNKLSLERFNAESSNEDISAIIRKKGYPEELWSYLQSPVNDKFLIRHGDLLDTSYHSSNRVIHKMDQSYYKVINIRYLGTQRSGRAFIQSILKKINKEMPAGFSIKEKKINFSDIGMPSLFFPLLLMIYLIYTICGTLFNSFKLPMVILGGVICSLSGIFLTFYLFDAEFNEGGLISVFLGTGLIINSIIYIISDYQLNSKYGKGMATTEILCQSVLNKIRPILITVSSTILGLSPFLILESSNSYWYSLALGTIGGIMVSFPMVLILTTTIIGATTRDNDG